MQNDSDLQQVENDQRDEVSQRAADFQAAIKRERRKSTLGERSSAV